MKSIASLEKGKKERSIMKSKNLEIAGDSPSGDSRQPPPPPSRVSARAVDATIPLATELTSAVAATTPYSTERDSGAGAGILSSGSSSSTGGLLEHSAAATATEEEDGEADNSGSMQPSNDEDSQDDSKQTAARGIKAIGFVDEDARRRVDGDGVTKVASLRTRTMAAATFSAITPAAAAGSLSTTGGASTGVSSTTAISRPIALRLATPPAQVAYDGNASEATVLTAAPLHHAHSLPSSPSRGAASSEEDSVAEMDYMSEGSNVSVKELASAPPESRSKFMAKVNNFVPSSTSSSGTQQISPKPLVKKKATKKRPGATGVGSNLRTGNGGNGGSGPMSSPGPVQMTSSNRSCTSTVHSGGNDTVVGVGSPGPRSTSTASQSSSSVPPPPMPRKANTATVSSIINNASIRKEAPAVVGTIKQPQQSSAGAIDSDCKPDAVGGGSSGIGGGSSGIGCGSRSAASAGGCDDHLEGEHRPLYLPKFREVNTCMWTASHAANCPTEDRSASLVNLLLQPLPPNFDSETQLPTLDPDYKTLIRLNLWAVIDGHGGGCVATYGSEVLLPHIAASVSRALGCAIVDRGVCTVNGQLRDANALDLDGLIKTSDRSLGNPNSIHYRSPYERSDSGEEDGDDDDADVNLSETDEAAVPQTAGERKQIASLVDAAASIAGTLLQHKESNVDGSVSSVKTSVKTAASPANREALLGTHSPREVAAITRAITESFLAVDEGWINSIDPVATHQTSCQSNGRWNSGACALVVFTIQRLDWTSVSEPDREKGSRGPDKSRRNTSQNRDAARRRMLDYAARAKSASSMSTVSSTSSLTTEEAVNASGLESEITETEGEDDDRSFDADARKRNPARSSIRQARLTKESLISPPGGCSCHCYRAHDAILYTAHVGDCRAVMLGCAPPRTIKVRGDCSHPDTTDDESSHHSSDETECLSSSDHDADSSEDEDVELETNSTSAATSSYMNFPRRVARQRASRRRVSDDTSGPYIALPPLDKEKTVAFDFETDIDRRERRRSAGKDLSDSSTSSQDSDDLLPLVHLPPVTRPIDLTTDHSAYNPAEVTAVLRRCNNAPRAISAGVGGGIKRVAGSLAVTRALGDAYLKTPLLSFLPYKSHAPYITARPEVNCRPIVKDGDKVLILATDGVWERASGEDVLRWVRNFYEERVAEAERRKNRRLQVDRASSTDETDSAQKNQQETAERDLFERVETEISCRKRDRDLAGSPSPPAKRRKRSRHNRISYNVADVIVRRVLNKVRRARNISSLQALMSLPQGRARRSKHDDITASVVDLSAFVS